MLTVRVVGDRWIRIQQDSAKRGGFRVCRTSMRLQQAVVKQWMMKGRQQVVSESIVTMVELW